MTNFCLDFCIRLKLQNWRGELYHRSAWPGKAFGFQYHSRQTISLELDLLVRPAGIVYQWTQTPVSGFIGRRFKVLKSTSFATKKVNAFQVNFSEFNNKLVAAFTTNGVENSVSFHCLTFFFLLWMLKNTFTTFPVSSQVFWCLEHTTNCFIFSKSGLKYPKPLQSLLSMNQVNLFKS